MEETTTQQCAECGTLIKGRVDKKFCSDLCRNAYNNRLNSDANRFIRNINNQLRKNRRILEEICPDDTHKTHRDQLVRKGFDFNFMTHQRTTRKGDIYTFIYDFGYLPLGNNFYLIVRNERKEA